ncbi:efflux RND transporter periplasmic adaptor subunit [Alsobacter sp. R-9]
MRVAIVLAGAAALLATAACRPAEEAAAPTPPRPVRTMTIGAPVQQAPVVFPGRIEAMETAHLGFRVGGRVTERLVGVGAQVKDGQVLARLDPEVELNDLRSARATFIAAESANRQAQGRLDRQAQLYARGVTSRAEFEAAEQAAKSARSQMEAAAAQVRIAEEVVGFTVLRADAAGVVTTVGAEPGEVVAPGRPVVSVARKDGRDAVLDVPAGALDLLAADSRVSVTIPGDVGVSATGRVREVSPEADPTTRLFRVRIGLGAAPGMRLGQSVQVSLLPAETGGLALPASAVVRQGPEAAVWVVDPVSGALARRLVEVATEDPGTVVITKGLAAGDVVVTAGASGLKAGQKVRLAGVEP